MRGLRARHAPASSRQAWVFGNDWPAAAQILIINRDCWRQRHLRVPHTTCRSGRWRLSSAWRASCPTSARPHLHRPAAQPPHRPTCLACQTLSRPPAVHRCAGAVPRRLSAAFNNAFAASFGSFAMPACLLPCVVAAAATGCCSNSGNHRCGMGGARQEACQRLVEPAGRQ